MFKLHHNELHAQQKLSNEVIDQICDIMSRFFFLEWVVVYIEEESLCTPVLTQNWCTVQVLCFFMAQMSGLEGVWGKKFFGYENVIKNEGVFDWSDFVESALIRSYFLGDKILGVQFR